jgi:hypothetical protein
MIKKAVTIRMSPEIEDRIAVHAARHKHKFTTMAQILMEEGLDARDLLEAARKEGGERK